MEKTPCNQCPNAYKQITLHWKRSSKCDYPNIPERALDILSGVYAVRGGFTTTPYDTYLYRVGKNTKQPLETLNDTLGVFSTGITEQVKRNKYGDDDATQYTLSTIAHPRFSPSKLIDREPTPLAQKAAMELSGTGNGCGTYRIVVPPQRHRRAARILGPIASSVQYKERQDTGRGVVGFWIPKAERERVLSIEWPSGWWNSDVYV